MKAQDDGVDYGHIDEWFDLSWIAKDRRWREVETVKLTGTHLVDQPTKTL